MPHLLSFKRKQIFTGMSSLISITSSHTFTYKLKQIINGTDNDTYRVYLEFGHNLEKNIQGYTHLVS